MSKRSQARLAVQHPEAATLGNVVGQVIAHLDAASVGAAPLDRSDRRRLLMFTNVLASARRGGEPLDQLITAREQARRYALDQSEAHEIVSFADDLPSVDEDRTNYDLMAKVLLEPDRGELDEDEERKDEERIVEFLGEAERAVRNLARMGSVSALSEAERALVTNQLPSLLERMAHVNDVFDGPHPSPQTTEERALGMPIG